MKHSKSSPSHKPVWLTPDAFELLCFDFAREQLSFNQPIPDYSTRDKSLLESALGSPSQTFDGKLLYPTLAKQSAILFYSIIKNHPFRNGNKRIGVMSLLVFLALNKKWLVISALDLYKLAISIAKSTPSRKDRVLVQLEKKISKSLKPFPHNDHP